MFYGRDLAYIHATGFHGHAEGSAPEIVRRLREAGVRHVVDAGCGAGPLAAKLIEAGFAVTGIDVSPELLALARQVAPEARFIEGSIYEAEIPACDAIVAVGEVLNYGPQPVQPWLERAACAVRPGGLLIFDVIVRGEPSLSARNWRSGAEWAVLADTHEDGDRLQRRIETFVREGDLYRRSEEVHHVRIFDSATLMADLKAAGFSVEMEYRYGDHALPPRRQAFFARRD